ncbi:ornithine cyclodeaminase family protein [Glutamicibacter sp. AGC13]
MNLTKQVSPVWYTSEQVAEAVSPDRARELLENALRDGFDPATDPDRTGVAAGSGEMLLMPSTIGEWSGIKVATVAPDNPGKGLPRIQANYILMDAETLSTQALLEGAMLTALRTPATSAVAAKHLAPSGPCTLMVFGTGPQAWGHIEAMSEIREITEVIISARNRERVDALVAKANDFGLAARAGEAGDVANAQLVVCATSASEPLFDGSLVQPGACVIAMGSHVPESRELDAELVGRSLVVVEDIATALREAGDVIQAIAEGTLLADDLATIANLVQGQFTRCDDRPNIFKGTGMSWQDLVVAVGVHEHFTN